MSNYKTKLETLKQIKQQMNHLRDEDVFKNTTLRDLQAYVEGCPVTTEELKGIYGEFSIDEIKQLIKDLGY